MPGAAASRPGASPRISTITMTCTGAGTWSAISAGSNPKTTQLWPALSLNAAADWLRKKGRDKIQGPFNFNINEECGLLINGFDTPPMVMMTHNPPFYQKLD